METKTTLEAGSGEPTSLQMAYAIFWGRESVEDDEESSRPIDVSN